MQDHDAIIKIDDERLKKHYRQEAKMKHSQYELKEELVEMLIDFETI